MWDVGQLLKAGCYKIVKLIGGGGFGLTYLANDPFLQRQVVIKRPNKNFQSVQGYETFVNRFQQEGQSLAKVSHPNVVPVIEFFYEKEIPCLVLAYVEGETIYQYIQNHGVLSSREVWTLFAKLSHAINLLHKNNVIHCDIHPGNIILQPNIVLILIDFGSS